VEAAGVEPFGACFSNLVMTLGFGAKRLIPFGLSVASSCSRLRCSLPKSSPVMETLWRRAEAWSPYLLSVAAELRSPIRRAGAIGPSRVLEK